MRVFTHVPDPDLDEGPSSMAPRIHTKPRKVAIQERSKATVSAILDGAARVLVDVGYDRASTNRVAVRAGVSVGSLYQYFPSKEALVAALIGRHIEEMRALLVETMAKAAGAGPEGMARALVRAMLAAHAVDPKLHRVLVEQTPRIGRLAKLHDVEREAVELAKSFLDAHVGQVREVNTELAAYILVTSVEALTHAAALGQPHLLEDDRFVDEVTHLVVAYLRPTH